MPGLGAFQFALTKTQWLLVGAVVGYALILFANPARVAVRDGWRALKRYPALWLTFGALGFANTLFHLAIRIYRFCVFPPGDRPAFMWFRAAWRDKQFWLHGSPESVWWMPPHGLHDAARDAVLPAAESVAGIFNNLVTTFPLAAVAAVLLLMNWDGHQMVLQRALRQRYRFWGWLAYVGILLGAVAVIAKVLLLYAAPVLVPLPGNVVMLWIQWGPVVEWLAFLFEYLFGVLIQVQLILLAYCWVRGLGFDRSKLLDFAIRRFAFVVKWALAVMILSSLFLNAPLVLKNFEPFAGWLREHAPSDWPDTYVPRVRAALAVFLFIFPTMQITLTFHSESILHALRDHWQFLGRHWWRFGWFLVVAGIHFYLWVVVNLLCSRGLGEGTAPGILWELLAPWANGIVGAWLLASWVCLYRSLDHDRPAHDTWVRF